MKASFIFFILYFIKFVSCYNIYNITYSKEIEVFHSINKIKAFPYTKSILRLKLDSFKNVYAKLKIKKGTLLFSQVEAFGYSAYPSDDILVEDKTRPLVKIKDGEYLIYLNKGEDFHPFDYIEDVKIGGRKYSIVEDNGNYGAEKIGKDEKIVVGQNQIDVEGEVDTDMPGEYVVKFSMTLDAGNQETVTGMRRIYVIVRDN